MVRISPATASIVAIAVVCALMLALPGRTFTSAFVNDLLIFLDGAHRVVWGQVPNRDFHTALGPLTYYIPALGYWISGRLGGAMPVGTALVILAFVPVTLHVTRSRLSPALAIPFAAFLFLLLAVPANLGDDLSSLSFAMFYNRLGWAALALLVVMYLRPLRLSPRSELRDAACAAVLVLFQLYTKITYGVVAVGFLAFLLLDRDQRRWSALALGLVFAAGALIELVWHGTMAHVADLLATARVSGERNPVGFVHAALYNLTDIVLFVLLACLAEWRAVRLLDVLFFLACLGTGLAILTQNAHAWGIITLYGGAVVAAELALRRGQSPAPLPPAAADSRTSWSMRLGAPLLLLVLVLPGIGRHAAALSLHTFASVAGLGQPLGLEKFADVRFGRLWSPGDNGFSEAYVGSFAEGGAALASLDTPAERVLVLDFANPFSAGLGLKPPAGDNSWLHWGRNVDRDEHLAPESMLADVQVVLEPAIGINVAPLAALYGPYIRDHFLLARQTDKWKVYVRPAPEEAD